MAIPLYLVAADQDRPFSDALADRLRHEERQGRISLLYPAEALPGSDLAALRERYLADARIFVILVSPDLVNHDSRWQETEQVLRQVARGAVVIPVLIRAVDLSHTPLHHLQSLPRDGRTLAAWPDPDLAWGHVHREIRTLIGPLLQGEVAPRERALMLYLSGRREEALPAFQAAYERSGDVLLLLTIARLHLDLGDAQRALEACDSLRREAPALPPEAGERLAELALEAKALQWRTRGRDPAATTATSRSDEAADGPYVGIRHPPDVAIEALAGTGPDDLWLVGRGRIYHHGGRDREIGYQGWKERVLHVYQPGDGALWAVGTGGMVLHFNGTSWHELVRPTHRDLIGVWGWSAADIQVMDTRGTIFRLSGVQWLAVEQPENEDGRDLRACFVLSQELVIAVGQRGEVARWDGARTTHLLSGTVRSLHGVWAAAPNDIWVVGDAGTIMHFDGLRWRRVPSGTERDLRGIWGAGPADVWAVGNAGTKRTQTGEPYQFRSTLLHFDGREWSVAVEETTGKLDGIGGCGPSDVVAVGEVIAHSDGGGWAELPRLIDCKLHSFVATGPGEGWAFGEGGVILRREQDSWSARHSHPHCMLRDIFRITDDDVWVVGDGGTILHFDGVHWSLVDSGTSAELHGVWASGPDDVWAVGGRGAILSWDGRRWSRVKSPTDNDLYSISGSGPTDIWAVGFDRTLLHYEGQLWTTQPSPSDFGVVSLEQIWSDGPGTAWIKDRSTPRLYRHAEGAWSPFPEGELPPMHSSIENGPSVIGGTGPRDVWMVDGAGRTSHFDGTAWEVVCGDLAELRVNRRVRPLLCTPSGDVWVAAEGWSATQAIHLFRLRRHPASGPQG